jgi:holo-ACP synthase
LINGYRGVPAHDEAVLKAILDAREARWLRRLELCDRGPLLTLVMNAPGPEKNLPRWNDAHRAITEVLREDLEDRLSFFERRGSVAGVESHFVVNMPPVDLKKYAVRLEEEHPIGRLLDADVMARGEVVDRGFLGLPPRRCLCCDREARACVREERHSPEELLRRANELLDAWLGKR